MNTDRAVQPPSDGRVRRRSRQALILVAVAVSLVLVVAVMVVRFTTHTYQVPGMSMEPTLAHGEPFVVAKWPWFRGTPHRGDIVVFRDPGDWLAAGPGDPGMVTKRVIGVPGDTITCCSSNGEIEINGHAVDEAGLIDRGGAACDAELPPMSASGSRLRRPGSRMSGPCHWTVGPVPPGRLFVLGDNRQNSADSRYHLCGPADPRCTDSPWVSLDLLVGRVVALRPSRLDIKRLHRPPAFDGVPSP